MVFPRNSLEVLTFDRKTFSLSLIPKLIGITPSIWQPPSQITYLQQYLSLINARGIIFERHYIDRHFMEEYSIYYSKCLNNVPNSCSRLHVFSEIITDKELEEALQEPGSSSEQKLQNTYLGFIVLRPIRSVLVGRTVLSPLHDDPERQFNTLVEYSTHLAGVELKILGLAFQQQDQRVGACATTAIWSALQRVSRIDGGRPPTPSQITDAATRNFLPHGRPYPSTGLTIEQICEAIRTLGFAPQVTSIHDDPLLAKIILVSYLHSGIPVILILSDGTDIGHAVTAVGYNFGNNLSPKYGKLYCPSIQLDKLYLHDDRLGPYTRATILPNMPFKNEHSSSLYLNIPIDWDPNIQDKWQVTHFIVPLYPKLRTSAEELLIVGMEWVEYLSKSLNFSVDRLGFDIFFTRSGDILREVRNFSMDPQSKATLLKMVALSRYVGRFQVYLDNQPFILILFDTTDRLINDIDNMSNISAIVCQQDTYRPSLITLFSSFEILTA